MRPPFCKMAAPREKTAGRTPGGRGMVDGGSPTLHRPNYPGHSSDIPSPSYRRVPSNHDSEYESEASLDPDSPVFQATVDSLIEAVNHALKVDDPNSAPDHAVSFTRTKRSHRVFASHPDFLEIVRRHMERPDKRFMGKKTLGTKYPFSADLVKDWTEPPLVDPPSCRLFGEKLDQLISDATGGNSKFLLQHRPKTTFHRQQHFRFRPFRSTSFWSSTASSRSEGSPRTDRDSRPSYRPNQSWRVRLGFRSGAEFSQGSDLGIIRVVPIQDIRLKRPSHLGRGKGPQEDEFHTRLRFNRRGLVAMANAGPHDNGSQFFFTLGRADELNNKHTIFGKTKLSGERCSPLETTGCSAHVVSCHASTIRHNDDLVGTDIAGMAAVWEVSISVTGDTIYNLLRLAEVDIGEEDRPVNPHKIRITEVLFNPFDDIDPRVTKKLKKEKQEEEAKQPKVKGTNAAGTIMSLQRTCCTNMCRGSKDAMKKLNRRGNGQRNFNLLSFGEEAEEEEEEVNKVSEASFTRPDNSGPGKICTGIIRVRVLTVNISVAHVRQPCATCVPTGYHTDRAGDSATTLKGKSKSSHDLLKDDPRLSSVPAIDNSIDPARPDSDSDEEENSSEDDEDDMDSDEKQQMKERISSKLKVDPSKSTKSAMKSSEDLPEKKSSRR
ncbi:unnamed protein product [Ranitomeya imitator]|uniref:Spliceosome-associated protein CWC27 homolog n=1 Tax=Ranitomeya imitator TaxID=111125 RepID=A0ABN9M9H6_9NEOB|nr:unnamed protein product [Ranitomeya imitator]